MRWDIVIIDACEADDEEEIDTETLTKALKLAGSDWLNENKALLKACLNLNPKVAQRLLTVEGIDVNQADEDGWTPLFGACMYNLVGIVRQLLRATNIQVNRQSQSNGQGLTPLYVACLLDHLEVVHLLLTATDIQVNKPNGQGLTPLLIASQKGFLEVVQALFARKELQINQGTTEGATPLYLACLNNRVQVVQALLARKEIQFNQANENGETPLHIACMYYKGNLDVVNLLLQVDGIQVNALSYRDGDDGYPHEEYTPLTAACMKDWLDVVHVLLQHKDIDINLALSTGATALTVACESGHLRIVNALLNFDPLDNGKYDAKSLYKSQSVDMNKGPANLTDKGPDNLTALDVAISSAQSAGENDVDSESDVLRRYAEFDWGSDVPLSERWDIVVRLEDIPSAKTNRPAVYKNDEGYIRAREKANVLQKMWKEIADNIARKSKTPGAGDLPAILGRKGYVQFVKKRK
jgi:ankyrin repeat protein